MDHAKMMEQVTQIELQFSKEINEIVGKYMNSIERVDIAASVVASGLTNMLGKLAAYVHKASGAEETGPFSKDMLVAIYTYQARATIKSFLQIGPAKFEVMTPELMEKILQMDQGFENGLLKVHN